MHEIAFINYRRETDKFSATRLLDRLRSDLGKEGVFIDIDGIDVGENYDVKISRQVAQCDVFLIVLGRNWLDVRDETGMRRIDKPNDWVRLEIESALVQEKRIIPLLLDGAEMPSSDQLPASLVPFSRRQAAKISCEQFHADVDRLLGAIRAFRETRRRIEDEELAKRRAQEEEQLKREAEEAARVAEDKRRAEEAEAASRREAEIRAAREEDEARSAEVRRQAEIAAERRVEAQHLEAAAKARRERELRSARARALFGNLTQSGPASPPKTAQLKGEPPSYRSEPILEGRDDGKEPPVLQAAPNGNGMSYGTGNEAVQSEEAIKNDTTNLSGDDDAFQEALRRLEGDRASRGGPTTLVTVFALACGAIAMIWPALLPRTDSLPAARESLNLTSPSSEATDSRSPPTKDYASPGPITTPTLSSAPSSIPPPTEAPAAESERKIAPAEDSVENLPARKKTKKKSRSR